MVRIILTVNGYSQIIYEGYDIEVSQYILLTIRAMGGHPITHREQKGEMIYVYIETRK